MASNAPRGKFHADARGDAYDAIVVGSGIGGLTAAALLARGGRRVLVVERHDRPGGYAHSFRRGPYLFDSAVHLVGGCEPDFGPRPGLIHQLLSSVGVRERCDFARVDPCYAVDYPGFGFRVSSGLESFAAAHIEAFPSQEDGIRAFLAECARIRDETSTALGSLECDPADARRFPSLRAYRRATVDDVLSHHVSDPQLRALLTTLWPYLGLPPGRLSFLYFAAMLMSYIADGAYYCRGTFQRMADALVEAVRGAGGEILYNSSVRRIRVADGRVAGVVLENGQRVEAPLVVSNADARQTVEELVGEVAFGATYRRALQRLRPSLSALVAYLALDDGVVPAETAHETFVYTSWDHEVSYQSSLQGAPSWLSATLPSRVDPSLAPEGETLMIVTTLVPFDVASWRKDKGRFEDFLLVALEKRWPGLRRGIKMIEVGTPRTMERYTRNSDGAIYGWDLSPKQIGPRRLRQRTPIEGLYLAGHWTQPGGGIYGVVTSGVQAAREILGHDTDAALWAALA